MINNGGKKNLSVTIMDEFYIFDLMEIRVKDLPVKLTLISNFRVKNFFFALYFVFYSSRR